MAHEGLDNVPKTDTWRLQQGERVVGGRTNAFEAVSGTARQDGGRCAIHAIGSGTDQRRCAVSSLSLRERARVRGS